MYRIALIGGGIVARRYVQAIENSDRARLVGVAETDPQRRSEITDRAKTSGYADYHRMLTETHPEVAIIALPHHLHLEAAETAMAAGAHVLIEKPLEISLERCDRIADAARKYKRQVFVGHTQRYYPWVREAKRLIDAGAIGEPLFITEVFFQRYFTEGRPSWYLDRTKSGGGILMNHGIHLVDRVSWLLDSRAVTVTAWTEPHPRFPQLEALATIHLTFQNGAWASLNISGFGGEEYVTFVAGGDGSLRFGDGDEILLRQVVSDEPMYAEHTTRRIVPQSGVPALQAELESFLTSLDRNEPVEIGLEWGRYAVEVIQMAYTSARTGRTVWLPGTPAHRASV